VEQDQPCDFGLHGELELLVAIGLTEAEALRTATLEPARYLEAVDTQGTVEVGKVGDLVLLDANPLEDISNTQKIRAVVANGRYFDRPALDELLADVEKAANEPKSDKE
jgi:imidazolonepropionase-like amidohydrolase